MSSYLPVKFVNVLKSRRIFNIFYCFWIFVHKLSPAPISKSKRCFNVKSSIYYFYMEEEDIDRFSNQHECTFKSYGSSFTLFFILDIKYRLTCGELKLFLEPVVQICSVKTMFLEISENSQENTCSRVSF